MIATILPIDACNQNCSYCTSSITSDGSRMNDDTLVNTLCFVQEVFEHEHQTGHIEWHAGEPLLMPISFYEYAETICKDIEFNAKRVFCSNLTLLNADWLDFIIKHDYGISTSIDGYKAIHDNNRGKGTHDLVMTAIASLIKNNISFGCVAVLSKESCNHAKDIYNFFRETGINVQINNQIPNDFHDRTLIAFKTMFDLWLVDHAPIIMQPFNKMVNFLLRKDYQKECSTFCNRDIFCVDSVGDVYPCERFHTKYYGNGEWTLGNVNTDSFSDIWHGDKRQEFLEKTDMMGYDCYGCDYIGYCNGGCSCERFIDETSDCDTKKGILNHISERIGWIGDIP